ncbi:hypothetical protein GCM10028820_01760 [Tessaracoccus terricola]
MQPTTAGNPSDADRDGADREQLRRTLLASLVALLVGAKLSVLLHEVAHWVTGAALGYPSRLYSFAVEHAGELTPTGEAIAALAGPVFSILLGLLLTFWLPLLRTAGVWHLVWLWTGFTSLQEGVTYFVITPFGAGDTALAADRLAWHPVVMIALGLLGVAGMFWQARRFADHIVRHCGHDQALSWRFAFIPWIIGSAVLVVIQLFDLLISDVGTSAAENFTIVFSCISLTVFAPMGFIFWNRPKVERVPLDLPRWPVGPAVLLVALLALNVVLLLTGPTIG